MRLYYHKTDGGAEYLCSNAVEGTEEKYWDTYGREIAEIRGGKAEAKNWKNTFHNIYESGGIDEFLNSLKQTIQSNKKKMKEKLEESHG